MSIQEFDERIPLNLVARFDDAWLPATGYTFENVETRHLRIDYLLGFNSDTVPHDMTFWVYDQQDEVRKNVGSVTIPAGSGLGALAPVDVLTQLLAGTGRALVLRGADTVEVFIDATPSAATYVTLWARGGWF